MDTQTKELQRLEERVEVEDLEHEVYLREVLGCLTKKDQSDTCAKVSCQESKFQVCQKAG